MTQEKSAAYIWFDTEFSSLDLGRAQLLQVAAMATAPDLRPLAPPERNFQACVRIHRDEDAGAWVNEHMPWLVAACRGPAAVEVADVDAALVRWLDEVVCPVAPPGRPVLAGNSIHCDWVLACKYLPRFISRLHYRHLDVTSWKLVWRDHYAGPEFDKESPAVVRQHLPWPMPTQARESRHDAGYDILASIAELNYYRNQLALRLADPGAP